jgi:hypothetical protein
MGLGETDQNDQSIAICSAVGWFDLADKSSERSS